MSAPTVIKLCADNVTDGARALAPGEGRRRELEIDAAALRVWLDHFAALPALEAEEAEARLHLAVPARRLVVRRAGGRLGAELGGTFVAATAEDIVAQLLAPAPNAGSAADVPVPDQPPPPKGRGRAQAWLLAALIAILAGSWSWALRSETPEGVAWIGEATERRAILRQAAGSYASEDERLSLDAAALLIATNDAGEETLRTTVRVGRRAGVAVLVAENGVLLEITPAGRIRIDSTDYQRVAAGP
jgi:hypothetical protein